VSVYTVFNVVHRLCH